MILALAVILGLGLSLVRHRADTTRQIAAMPLRSAWLALVALVFQIPLLRSPFGPTQQFLIPQILFLLSHVLLLIFVWLNRQLLGMQIVGIGVLLNLLVIVTNGGFMPITPESLLQINPGTTSGVWQAGNHYGYSKDVILARQDTNLWFLSDILVVPPPFPWPVAFSLGDLFIGAGIIVLLSRTYVPNGRSSEIHEVQKS
jgi:hypothetical protein